MNKRSDIIRTEFQLYTQEQILMECPSCAQMLSSVNKPCAHCQIDWLNTYQCQQDKCKSFQSVIGKCKKCNEHITGSLSGKSLTLPDSVLLIREKLGRGGMGEVYRGIELQDERPKREVAVKFNSKCDNLDLYHRFKRETQYLLSINHPHCVQMYGYGEELEQDVLQLQFLYMELLRGETLAQKLSLGPLTYREIEIIFPQIASALYEIHQKGLIHRDLKPDNIMLQNSLDGHTHTKLFDFGLAKEIGTEAQAYSQTGLVLGTLWYMSPEQARGEEVDHRSDFFSLGVILYQGLTGQIPYPAKNLYELYQLHLRGPQPYPEEVPQPIIQILQNSLTLEPESRRLQLETISQQMEDLEQSEHAHYVEDRNQEQLSSTPPYEFVFPKYLLWTVGSIVCASALAALFIFTKAKKKQKDRSTLMAQKTQKNQIRGVVPDRVRTQKTKRKNIKEQTELRKTPKQVPSPRSQDPALLALSPIIKRKRKFSKVQVHFETSPKCQTLHWLRSTNTIRLEHSKSIWLPPGRHTLQCVSPTIRLRRTFTLSLSGYKRREKHKEVWTAIPLKILIRRWAFPYVDSFFIPNCQDGCQLTLWSGVSLIELKRPIQGTKRHVTVYKKRIKLERNQLRHPFSKRLQIFRWAPK